MRFLGFGRPFFRRAVAAALLTLLAAGCGGRGDVAGKVTYKGKSLVWGTVQFEGSDGGIRQANIKGDGSFFVRGITIGQAKAAVSSVNPKSSDFQMRRGPDKLNKRPPKAEVTGWFPIPEKYDTPFNSGLTFQIKQGENKIDIELQ